MKAWFCWIIAAGVGASAAAQQTTLPPPPPVANVPGASNPAASPAGSGNVPGNVPANAVPNPGVPAKPGEAIRERFPNGAVAVERHVTQDAKGNFVNHGPWTQFSPDGKKLGGGEFVAGQRVGLWTRTFGPGEGEMFANPLYREYRGPFTSSATFQDGKLHGAWAILDGQQQKISEWHFAGGVQHGPWTWFHPNGAKRREATYDKGQLIGVVQEWAPSGQLASSVTYIDGQRREPHVGYHAPGVKSAEGWYLRAKEQLRTTYNWWEGQAVTEVAGVTGRDVHDGKWTWWFPNGQKSAEGAYVRGAKDGPWTWWHPNGQKWIAGAYVLDKKSGPWTHWAPDGTVERTEQNATVPPPPAPITPSIPGATVPPAPPTNPPATTLPAAPQSNARPQTPAAPGVPSPVSSVPAPPQPPATTVPTPAVSP